MFSFIRYRLDHRIRKLRPPDLRMTHRFIRTNGKRCIQQHHSLLCPFRKITMRWNTYTKVFLHFVENIEKRGWARHSMLDGKTISMRLVGTMIWILPEYNRLYFVDGSFVEAINDESTGWRDEFVLKFFR